MKQCEDRVLCELTPDERCYFLRAGSCLFRRSGSVSFSRFLAKRNI